jgi:KaiC/GvpD/RAD55 family RecA-like ATPase
MIGKTPIGVPFFDAEFGGVYPNRVVLVTGRAGAGKTVLGLHFIDQGLRQHERALMLSARPAQDLVISAESMGMSFAPAIESGALTLLEYSEFVPGRDQEANINLPPDGFIQLKEIIEQQVVNRVVIDTVLPWITLPDPAHLPEHIFSLVRAFERLGVTALFTLPRPVSANAGRLRKLVEDVVPVSLTLLREPDRPSRQMVVSKYLGMNAKPEGFNFDIVAQQGLVLYQPAPVPGFTAPAAAAPAQPAPHPAPAESPAAAPAGRGRISFASMVLDQSPSARSGSPRPVAVPPPMRGVAGIGGGG